MRSVALGPQGELAGCLRLGPRLHFKRWCPFVQPSQRSGARMHRDEGREPEASDGPVLVPSQYQGFPPSVP